MIEELKKRAREKATATEPLTADASEALRAEVSNFLSRIPVPPVYLRRDDPALETAARFLSEGEELLAQVYQDERLVLWQNALELHLEAQELVRQGKLEPAETAHRVAINAEHRASNERRLWASSDEQRPPIFSRDTGESRFDSRPEATLQAKLCCPLCQTVASYELIPRHASHGFTCPSCRGPFHVYLGVLKAIEVTRKNPRERRYDFHLEEPDGSLTQIQFNDASDTELAVARTDRLAFLYAPRQHLRGVLNLSSSRVLWITQRGFCFVASAVLGEEAPELDTFRAFRDRVLMPYVPRAVDAYYRWGPTWARWVVKRPSVRFLLIRVLIVLERGLRGALK